MSTPAKGKRTATVEAPGAPLKKKQVPIVEEPATQEIPESPPAFDVDGELFPPMTFLPLELDPSLYVVLSLPFARDDSIEGANIKAMGLWEDTYEGKTKGHDWVVLVTDKVIVKDGSEFTLVFKVYNKTTSDTARNNYIVTKMAAGNRTFRQK